MVIFSHGQRQLPGTWHSVEAATDVGFLARIVMTKDVEKRVVSSVQGEFQAIFCGDIPLHRPEEIGLTKIVGTSNLGS